jgi:protein TonB
MFQESLVESTPLLRSHNRWPAFISITAQALVVAAIIALPLLHPEVLPLRVPTFSLIPPPRPPQPPPPRVHVDAASTAAPSAPAAAPASSIIRITTAPTTPSDAPPLAATLNLAPAGNGPLNSLTTGPANTPTITTAPSPTKPTRPTRISSGVSAGLLLAPIQPIYPAIALAARAEGTVVVQAIISRSGHIEAAHATSGPIMLQSAAVDAVRNARYRPFLLNNQPTEVETTITITFRLNT